SVVASGLLRDGPWVRALARLERFVYRRADHLLVLTEGARQNLISKGVAPGKVSVMPNWGDEALFKPAGDKARCGVREQYGWEGRFVVLFAGNVGLVQGLDTVVRAASQLPDEKQVLLVLMGDGTDKQRLQELASSLGVNGRLQFVERQPMERMPE